MPSDTHNDTQANPEVEWARLKAHELRRLAEQDAVVIFPLASIEQHGPHLPVVTDTCLGHEVAVRAARGAYRVQPTIVAPVLWAGLSEHHMPFGGTLTLDHDTFIGVLRCLVRSVKRHGFTKILFSNSHGGNILAMKAAVDQLAPEFDMTLVATSYSSEGAREIAPLLEDQPHVMHACEAETSMMMVVMPELVDASNLGEIANKREQGPLHAGRASYRWRNFAHATANGVSGVPTRASAEKGEKILVAAGNALTALITDPETWAPMQDKRGPDVGGVGFRTGD